MFTNKRVPVTVFSSEIRYRPDVVFVAFGSRPLIRRAIDCNAGHSWLSLVTSATSSHFR